MKCITCGVIKTPRWYGKEEKKCCRCYSKEYRQTNKHNVKETLAKYAKSQKGKTRTKKWAHSESGKQSSRKRGARYRGSQRYAEYIKSDRYKQLKKRYSRRSYLNKQPHYYSKKRALRRASMLQATPKWVRSNWFESHYKRSNKDYEVDHIIPLVNRLVCGLHVPWNLQILNKKHNRSKGNKFDGTYDNESWRTDLEGGTCDTTENTLET